jgi:hypothetical protein
MSNSMLNKLSFLRNMCPPAFLYFMVSMISLIVVFFQNLGNTRNFNVGKFTCKVPHTMLVFAIKFIYIVFWAYVLDLICRDGHVSVSWILVLFPWIVLLIIFGMIVINK